MITSNYETIVKNIVKYIRNGTIISNNTEKIENHTVKELFSLFTNEFDLNFHTIQLPISIENEILKIHIPTDCIFINELYLNSVGKIITPVFDNISIDSDIYFDLLTLKIPRNLITQYQTLTLKYISYNKNYNKNL